MQAVAHTAPVTALELLNVESSAEDKQAQHHYAEKTEIHSPQYVAFYFHETPIRRDGFFLFLVIRIAATSGYNDFFMLSAFAALFTVPCQFTLSLSKGTLEL
jgi:hypothetical protein